MTPSLPPVPANASRVELTAHIRLPEVSQFLTNYYAHHRFVCTPRFTNVPSATSDSHQADSQYPDLNASLVLPALKLPAGTSEIKGLHTSKIEMYTSFWLGLVTCFLLLAEHEAALGLVAFVFGSVIATIFHFVYRERLTTLSEDLTTAMAPITPQARTVLSKIVKSFDSEQDDIPSHVQSYADATFYLSNLRKRMYQATQERESAHRVKLAEIEAAARVAFAV